MSEGGGRSVGQLWPEKEGGKRMERVGEGGGVEKGGREVSE